MYAVIHRGHPAWRTITCVPSPPDPAPDTEVLPWPAAPDHEIYALCAQNPGVPLGLTFDGGIAVTATDYRLAERRYSERPER